MKGSASNTAHRMPMPGRTLRLLLMTVAILAGSAQAAPMSYEFSGINSGTINGFPFGPTTVGITATGVSGQGLLDNDICNALDLMCVGANASLLVGDLGPYSILGDTMIVSTSSSIGLGYTSGWLIVLLQGAADNWDPMTTLAPSTGTAGRGTPRIATEVGVWQLDSWAKQEMSVAATGFSTPGEVPLPAAFWLFGSAIAALVARKKLARRT